MVISSQAATPLTLLGKLVEINPFFQTQFPQPVLPSFQPFSDPAALCIVSLPPSLCGRPPLLAQSPGLSSFCSLFSCVPCFPKASTSNLPSCTSNPVTLSENREHTDPFCFPFQPFFIFVSQVPPFSPAIFPTAHPLSQPVLKLNIVSRKRTPPKKKLLLGAEEGAIPVVAAAINFLLVSWKEYHSSGPGYFL